MNAKRTSSLESIESVGFGLEDPNRQAIPQISGPFHYGYHIYDSECFAIICKRHKKMPLIKLLKDKNKSALWLPFVKLSPGLKWEEGLNIMNEYLSEKEPNKRVGGENETEKVLENVTLIWVSRFQLPNGLFINRNIYIAEWKATNITCCMNTAKIEWHRLVDVTQGRVNNKLWGSEVLHFANFAEKLEKGVKLNLTYKEYTMAKALTYCIKDEGLRQNNTNESMFKELLRKINYNDNAILKIYSNFIQHCYPSEFMSFASFSDFFTKLEINEEALSLKKVFQSINCGPTGYLGFNEFLLGLAVIEPDCPHGKARGAYIFRYYSNNRDYLERNEFNNLISDMKKRQHKSSNLKFQEREMDLNYSLENIFKTNQISFESFMEAIDSKALRGTSLLLRSDKSILKLISDKNIYESISDVLMGQSFLQKSNSMCPKCRPKKYKLAAHSVKLVHTGRIGDYKSILFTDGKDVNFKNEEEFIELSRKHSMEFLFKDRSDPNYVLKVIRDFGAKIRDDKKSVYKSQYQQSMSRFLSFTLINNICKKVEPIFMTESRVIKVNSPAYVMGDIHGNILDLLLFEEQLWRTGPSCNTANILFEGDYVDRGEYSIEVVLYLFSMKILAPDKFFLLRGNHEIRAIQKCFTFERECNRKYRNDGQKIFEIINNVFDVLPIAATVDETIFCAHGGIPYSVTNIEDLMKIPTPLKEPETESPAAWQILWSDPISNEDFKNALDFMHLRDETGFIPNTKRSTAFYYSEKAVENFMKANRISHIIRGHEVEPNGYKFNLKEKVITIFSCSKYCGGVNTAACAFIDSKDSNEGLIKIIMLDT